MVSRWASGGAVMSTMSGRIASIISAASVKTGRGAPALPHFAAVSFAASGWRTTMAAISTSGIRDQAS